MFTWASFHLTKRIKMTNTQKFSLNLIWLVTLYLSSKSQGRNDLKLSETTLTTNLLTWLISSLTILRKSMWPIKILKANSQKNFNSKLHSSSLDLLRFWNSWKRDCLKKQINLVIPKARKAASMSDRCSICLMIFSWTIGTITKFFFFKELLIKSTLTFSSINSNLKDQIWKSLTK